MIRLGLRLTLAGGREAVVRLVLLVASVGLGVGLLLIAVAGVNAVNTQNARYAWLSTGDAATAAGAAKTSADPLWWLIRADRFDGQLIGRIDVAATGPTSPVPPGIGHLPGPGQYYASPALAALLRRTPADQLAGRYPGHLIGTIGDAALPSPNSLLIVIGRTAGQLARTPGAVRATAIATTPPSGCQQDQCLPGEGMNANSIDLVMSVVAVAILFPLLIFIGTATRLSAARREERFAAMRLAGATPRQISLIAAVESTVAAVAGMAAGFGLFFLLRVPLASIPFTGAPFFPGDLSLSLPDVLLVALGVPLAAAIVSRLALRRVRISPLGVTRRVTPKAPRGLAGASAAGRRRHPRFHRGARAPADHPGADPGFPARLRPDHGGPGHRRPVADPGRGPAHGPADQPTGHADRGPPARRQPEGRVPRGERPGPGPVHHHRGRRSHHHAGCQGRRAARRAGGEHPGRPVFR